MTTASPFIHYCAIYDRSSFLHQDHKWSGVKTDAERKQVKAIYKRLIAERKRQGLSQVELARLSDISRSGLRHLESLETNPTLLTILKVSKALKFGLKNL